MEGGKEGKVLSFSWVLFFNGGVGSVRKRQRGGERERELVRPPRVGVLKGKEEEEEGGGGGGGR